MQVGVDRDRLATGKNLVWIPGITPAIARRQIDLLSSFSLLPDRRDQNVLSIKIRPPIRPGGRRFWIDQEQRAYYWHARLRRFLRIFVAVIDQSLMKARVEAPDRDQLRVVTRFTREVPKGYIACWANFHNRSERAEAQPTPAHFLFQQLLIVAAGVRSPVRITH